MKNKIILMVWKRPLEQIEIVDPNQRCYGIAENGRLIKVSYLDLIKKSLAQFQEGRKERIRIKRRINMHDVEEVSLWGESLVEKKGGNK